MKRTFASGLLTSLQFFSKLRWLEGSPLLDMIEPMASVYGALTCTARTARRSTICCSTGRGKKNFKFCNLVLAAIY